MSHRQPLPRGASILLILVLAFWLMACGEAPPVPPADPPQSPPSDPHADLCPDKSFLHPPTLSGELVENIPFLDADDPATPTNARPFFDNFSWRSLIALAWPSDPAKDRGQPVDPTHLATFENPPAGTVPAFFSYRTADDLFATASPPAWSAEGGGENPCDPSKGKVFLMLTKSGTVFDNLNEAFSYPLIDQNKNYVYFDVQFNQIQYDFIRDNEYYLISKLAADEPITMPESIPGGTPPDADGSIMIKTAWRQMTDEDKKDRYFTVDAQLFVPSQPTTTGADGRIEGTCQPATMGLTGIHIVRKIKGFPQWIWSTFEQVDNIELPPHAPEGTKISFNNGTDDPKTEGGWANRPPALSPDLEPKDERVPVQVTRYNPIPDSPAGCATPDVTTLYQSALAETGTPWQYYQLIATQWPSEPDQFKYKEDGGIYPQDCGAAFPANGIVNVSAETYVQSPQDAMGAGGNSCMSCHYGADQADFSWVLMQRAHQ